MKVEQHISDTPITPHPSQINTDNATEMKTETENANGHNSDPPPKNE